MTVMLKQRSDILYMAGNTHESELDCPSWAPDFRDIDLPHPFEDIIRSRHANASTRFLAIDESNFSIDGRSLKLRGMILGYIVDCSSSELWHPGKSVPITDGVPERIRDDHAQEVLGTLQAWVRMAVGASTSDLSQSWQQSLVDTITGFRYNQHNSIADMNTYTEAAESWCAAVLLSDIDNKSAIDNDTKLWSAIDKVNYHSCEDLKPALQRLQTSKFPLGCDYKTVLRFLQMLGGDFRSVMLYTRKRRFFTTKNKHMGIGPVSMKKGDIILKITGLDYPFLLREAASKGQYQLIGDVHAPSLVTVNIMVAGTLTESYFRSDLKKVDKDSAHVIRIQRIQHQMNSEGLEAEAARIAGGEFVEEDVVIV